MKLLKRYVTIFIMLISIFESCPQAMLVKLNSVNVESSLIVDKNINEKSDYLTINVKIPQINGLDNKNAEKVINNKILNFTNMWIKDVREIADEYYGTPNTVKPIFPYELTSKYTIKNQDKILSFYTEYYQFTGGAHGITNIIAYNIDIKSGEELLLKDLFLDEVRYKEIIDKEIVNEISKNPDAYFSGKDGFMGIKENQQYYIDGTNIIIYFDEYEIAPYVAGIPRFEIPIKKFGDTFKYY